MRLPALRTATATGLALVIVLATGGSAAVTEDATRFYLRQNGCGTAQEPGRLSTESGAPNRDAGDGCGTIGGVPLDEAWQLAFGEPLRTVEFTASNGDGIPLVVDAARDVVGQIGTRTWTGTPGGVGEVVVDLALTGTFRNATGQTRQVDLGAGTFRAAASPTSVTQTVPFRLDVPPAAQGVTLTGMTLSVVTRGANVNAQARSLNGRSFFDVPTLVTDTDA